MGSILTCPELKPLEVVGVGGRRVGNSVLLVGFQKAEIIGYFIHNHLEIYPSAINWFIIIAGNLYHDDVIKWKHFPRYWPFVRGIHRSRWIQPVPVNSPYNGQWRGALMFSLICAWINDWVNNREAGDLRRHRGHYDVNVMPNVCQVVPWTYANLLLFLTFLDGPIHRGHSMASLNA